MSDKLIFNKYLVAPEGYIKNLKSGRILKPSITKGYLHITLSNGHERITTRLHQIVAQIFLGPCPDNKQINHKDGNKFNNNISNLEYVSCRENIQHAIKMGLFPKAPNRKLSKKQISLIKNKKSWKHGERAFYSRKFNVSISQISSIIKGKSWAN